MNTRVRNINKGINMTSNLSEGVGKKIVDALRQQSQENASPVDVNIELTEVIETPVNLDIPELSAETIEPQQAQPSFEIPMDTIPTSTPVAPIVNQNQQINLDLENFEVPSNVAVLKNLINQLPSGVSKQMGAQIIKQTMEALGISMKSVLQEAQQLQQSLNNATAECQATIQEYKNNILTLEKQAQSNQKQYSALNDLISLFIQTGR